MQEGVLFLGTPLYIFLYFPGDTPGDLYFFSG